MNIEIGGWKIDPYRVVGTVLFTGALIGFNVWRQPRVGKACSTTDWVCDGHAAALVCRDGQYVSAPCHGGKGCYEDGKMIRCDTSQGQAGDVCVEDGSGECGADGKSLLKCTGGKITVKECLGPDACKTKDNNSHCDLSVGKEGGGCQGDGLACSVDGASTLSCTDAGVFVLADHCRGAGGCALKDDKIQCDSSIAEVGDTCDNGAACTRDGTGFLSCDVTSHTMVQTSTCHHRDTTPSCHFQGEDVVCDHEFGREGDLCTDGSLCSEDGRSRLDCKDGHFVKGHACHACVVEGERIVCR